MSKRDYYEILGVSKNAGAEEIKRAYRKLAIENHPDKHKGEKAAEERFKEISEAFEVLSDPNKKSTYDRFGHEGLKGAFGSGGFQWQDFTHFGDFEDIFAGLGDFFRSFGLGNDIFGAAWSGRSRTGPVKGRSLEYEIEIEFKEAVFGVEKTIEIARHETCHVCKGSGAKPGTKESTCSACHGRGQVSTVSGFFSIVRTCDRCGGRGSIIKDPCVSCAGTGREKIKRKIKIKVPAGVDNGTRLRITGEGEAGERGGRRGDLYVVIYVREHEIFQRSNNDIYCEVPVSFAQAVLGADIEVPTLEGKVKMNVPAGTQSGKVFRLRGKGVPDVGGYGKGDQHVRVVVETPTNLSPHQKKLLKEFAEACGEKSMPRSSKFGEKIKRMFK